MLLKHAPKVVAKVSALPSVTIPVAIARRNMNGTGATCMVLASTLQTWLRRVIDIAHNPRLGKTADRCMHDVVNVRALDEEELDQMIEPEKAAQVSRGLGASIQGLDGSIWGRVVGDEGDCWRLHSGRIAKKQTEGAKWRWCATEEVSTDAREGSAEKSDLLFVKGLGCKCRHGYSVVNSEYIAFHPHQCLPKYEIEYEIGW